MVWEVDKAIEYLQNIDKRYIKNRTTLNQLIGYLERNRELIPCYEIRKKLGLRNSSNIGEKMNDLLVSSRQKHNGMSWSRDGSVSLASITTLVKTKNTKIGLKITKSISNSKLNFITIPRASTN